MAHPGGRPSLYKPEYVQRVVEFCAQGYSLTAFAGDIGVCRETVSEWCREHQEFSVAAQNAKALRAKWWEAKARDVVENGGKGPGQATLIVFGLKNHAPEEFSDKMQHEVSGQIDLIPDSGVMTSLLAVLATKKPLTIDHDS